MRFLRIFVGYDAIKLFSLEWRLVEKLFDEDYELINCASKVIVDNYDKVNYRHTVGAAIRCKNGKIYVGINVYSAHGACAEQIALGSAISAGEREFECIVAVRGIDGKEILPPCGNCRQIFSDYMPDCKVILTVNNEKVKVDCKDLLPFACITKS